MLFVFNFCKLPFACSPCVFIFLLLIIFIVYFLIKLPEVLTLHLVILGSASGNGTHPPFKYKNPISLKAGKNEIALLSMTVGLQVSYNLNLFTL